MNRTHTVLRWLLLIPLCNVAFVQTQTADANTGQATIHSQHTMQLNAKGMVMNHNATQLPRDCAQLNGEHTFTIYAGTKFAATHPGTVYGLSQHEYHVEPCSLVTVTFINDDSVRHQWMLHGLPRYLYTQGMFTLEAAAGQRQTGSFIMPSDRKTYLVHCDVAQHMEKGMKAQLKVGGGDGNLFAIPGISSGFKPDRYFPANTVRWSLFAIVAGLIVATVIIRRGDPYE